MNGFLIAGTASGVGKTTVALAIMAGLRARGLTVQPFKCGPDFIDAGHHTAICGRPSRTLDTWMLSGETNQGIFASASTGTDVAVVEGMMGLFDGVAGGGEEGSSAEIAKLLELPVVLVLDVGNSARSIAAVVRGFEVFDPRLRLEALVLNRVAGNSHFRLLESAIHSTTSLPILGWFPEEPAIAIPERHLGVQTAPENAVMNARSSTLSSFAQKHLNLDVLMQFESSLSWPRQKVLADLPCAELVRVGVARDKAFSFYYEDNLDALRELGAEIVEWSPLEDETLPANLDALYIGGGYPELYPEKLSRNGNLLEGVRAFAQAGKPVYGECGGMMYLAETLRTLEGVSFPMAGLLPLAVEMTNQLVHFGYADATFEQDCLLGEKGNTVRGHSFHCSRTTEQSSVRHAYRIHYSLSGKHTSEGYVRGNLLASYLHLHFRSHPMLAQSFVKHTRAAKHLARVAC
jgi:cobyrinic acid a,c-diamide synthase